MEKTISLEDLKDRLKYLNEETSKWPDWKKQFTSYVPRDVASYEANFKQKNSSIEQKSNKR